MLAGSPDLPKSAKGAAATWREPRKAGAGSRRGAAELHLRRDANLEIRRMFMPCESSRLPFPSRCCSASSAVPHSGIDINLPVLSATGATLNASASDVGLTMSGFVLSLAVMPLIYGPASDRFGRKPIVVLGILLFVMGSVACAFAPSLPALLVCRVIQGIGAAATGTIFAMIRDLFDGNAARIKIANVMVAVNVATMIAPTAGAALLTLGSRRSIYAIQAGIGLILLLTVLFGFSESARIDPTLRSISATISNYRRVFFIGVVGLRPEQYGLIFSACSAAIMGGASWTVASAVGE
jgi:DHA1 family bicyclomycin/chloramphenicol resistance-like MFS transporter